jgi:hypothetical protein
MDDVVVGTLWRTHAAQCDLIDQQNGSFILRVSARNQAVYDEPVGVDADPHVRADQLLAEFLNGDRPTAAAVAWQRLHRAGDLRRCHAAVVMWNDHDRLYGVYAGRRGEAAPRACRTQSLDTAQRVADELVQAADPHDCEAAGCSSWAAVGKSQ